MNKKMRHMGYLAVAAVLAVAVLAYVLGGSNGRNGGGLLVETSAIERGDIIRSVATTGAVRPLITVEVGSQLSGQIAEIHADFNTPVEKGQLIALIDAKTFETRVSQDRANLKVAESNVIVQRAAIDRAKANLRKARLEYERAEPLSRQGTLSAAEYDASLAAYESARADLTMAEAQLQNALATLEQRQASLDSSLIDLERTKIRSPIDGVVIERAVDQGQTVAASLSSPVLFLIAQDLTKIQIEANVDEADIGNIREGNPVTFTVDAHPDIAFNGQVDQVRLAPNELNNVVTYTVIITAQNPDLKLLPGMTAIVEIVTGRSENVLRVTNRAIRFKPPESSGLPERPPESGTGEGRQGLLWIERDGGDITPAGVRFGMTDGSFTEVYGGEVRAGDRAVTRMRQSRK
jgi:HlyD family secretion protein